MARLKKYKEGTQVMSFSVPRKLYPSLNKDIKRLAGMEGLSASEWIWKQLQWVIDVKHEGNSQPELLHITEERHKLSKTIRAKFCLQKLNGSLDKLEGIDKKREAHQYNFHLANIQKNLAEAESLSKHVFEDRFKKVFERINKVVE